MVPVKAPAAPHGRSLFLSLAGAAPPDPEDRHRPEANRDLDITPVTSYSGPGSTDDIYLRRPDRGMEEEIRLTDFGWEVGMADWAPDGRSLVYGAATGGRMQLFSRAPEGGPAIQLTHGDFDHVQPQISPDGRWIAATRIRHTKALRRSQIPGR